MLSTCCTDFLDGTPFLKVSNVCVVTAQLYAISGDYVSMKYITDFRYMKTTHLLHSDFCMYEGHFNFRIHTSSLIRIQNLSSYADLASENFSALWTFCSSS